jgi:hypothetical protein
MLKSKVNTIIPQHDFIFDIFKYESFIYWSAHQIN